MAKDRKPHLTWEREEDQDWAASLEVRLALDHDAPPGLADQVLAEVHQLVHEERRPAHDLLGDPGAYAQLVADERITEEHRARVDAHGLTPGERFTASFVSFGIGATLFCAFEWIRDGLWVGIGWPSLTLTATVILGVGLTGAALAAWTAGRIHGARWWAVGAAGMVCAGVTGTAFLPSGQLFTVPAPLLLITCVAVVVGAVAFPDSTLDRWFTPPPVDRDDEAWFARLDGLLRGRHAMSSAQARDHIREARHHLASHRAASHRAAPYHLAAQHPASSPDERRTEGRSTAAVDLGERATDIADSDTRATDITNPEERATDVVGAEERATDVAGVTDVFGDVEVYALRLAEGPSRTRRFARRQFYGSCALTLFLLVMLIDKLTDPDPSPFWLAANTGALGAMIWTLVSEWRQSTTHDAAHRPGTDAQASPDSPS